MKCRLFLWLEDVSVTGVWGARSQALHRQWLRDTTAVLGLWLEPGLGHPRTSRGQLVASTPGSVLVMESLAPFPGLLVLVTLMLARSP